VTQNPDSAPGGPPPEPGAPQPAVPSGPPSAVPAAPQQAPFAQPPPRAATPGHSWFRGKAWLLLTVPIGLTTWAAFLYIGIRARRAQWLAWTVVYLATLAGWLALSAHHHETGAEQALGAVLWLGTWVGGGIHAFAVSDEAMRRIRARADPALEAARARIDRRNMGRHLLATQPALARELGVGRPDVPGADDYGLIDVNHCPAAVLTRLPGITEELAGRIVAERAQVGGFSSTDDLGVTLDLPPATVDQIWALTVFVKD
jgi:DNA uptake protein ComE-like DNA-binding protein